MLGRFVGVGVVMYLHFLLSDVMFCLTFFIKNTVRKDRARHIVCASSSVTTHKSQLTRIFSFEGCRERFISFLVTFVAKLIHAFKDFLSGTKIFSAISP